MSKYCTKCGHIDDEPETPQEKMTREIVETGKTVWDDGVIRVEIDYT